ncbi:MAG: argininosuccinate lyase [Puniceicoccaceae bacterium]|nr:MAG: argininosuccinate lyase [Puniceicoccaceae bacterium]
MQKRAQATWGGRFSEGPSALMQGFSESVSFDCRLAPYDLRVNRAHARMLCAVGLLEAAELKEIESGLTAIEEQVRAGSFIWDQALEDVHMNLEQALGQLTPAAAKLHTGRSRNDQVATDVRLFFKDAAAGLDRRLAGLMRALVRQAGEQREILIPGYTHLQRAQPVSVAHHLLAYVEMLSRDRLRLAQAADRANWCPLGCGAIAGTTLPIDREATARELGFVDAKGRPRITPNSMDAVADRDLFLDFAQACVVIGIHLSRMAEDLILWSSREFSFVDLPDAFCTGSSLMPQKKNPDALELIRGKSGRLAGNLQALVVMTKGLPLTYNRDLQEDKLPIFDSFDQAELCVRVLTGVVDGMHFRPEICAAAVADPALLATDLADWLVTRGVPFREAHHAVGALVRRGEELRVPLDKVPQVEAEAVHAGFQSGWTEVFDLGRALRARERPGMPGPRRIAFELRRWEKTLAGDGEQVGRKPGR